MMNDRPDGSTPPSCMAALNRCMTLRPGIFGSAKLTGTSETGPPALPATPCRANAALKPARSASPVALAFCWMAGSLQISRQAIPAAAEGGRHEHARAVAALAAGVLVGLLPHAVPTAMQFGVPWSNANWRVLASKVANWDVEELREPRWSSPWALLANEGATLWRLGLEDLAEREFGRAFQVDPTSRILARDHVAYFRLLHRPDEYVHALRTHFPGEPESTLYFLMNGDLEAARQRIEQPADLVA